MKNRSIILIMVLSLMIVLYGFVRVNLGMPKFIKDRSSFNISYNPIPFDFRVKMGDYSLYINDKVGSNIKSSSERLLNNIQNGMHKGVSNFINKTSTVFENAQGKIIEVIQNKDK